MNDLKTSRTCMYMCNIMLLHIHGARTNSKSYAQRHRKINVWQCQQDTVDGRHTHNRVWIRAANASVRPSMKITGSNIYRVQSFLGRIVQQRYGYCGEYTTPQLHPHILRSLTKLITSKFIWILEIRVLLLFQTKLWIHCHTHTPSFAVTSRYTTNILHNT